MFGDYIARGSAGAVFSSPSDPNQVIKIFNLDARDDMVSHMNRLQFQFFEELEAQQKQDLKTPGLPQINYTFTGEMTPEIMTQISESIKPSQQFDYASIKSNFRYGDKYAIILMDRVSKVGPLIDPSADPLGRRGLTPMLRHAYQMGYYVRDLWPENKGMSSAGDIIWFDPMVAPVNPVTNQDREALKILFEWDEYRQRQYQEAVRDKSYFDYEHKAGLFYAENNTAISSVTYKNIEDPEWLKAVPRQMLLKQNNAMGIVDESGNIFYEVELGNDYANQIKQMVVDNPNGFMMTWKGSDFIDPPKFEASMDRDHTFWVYPLSYATGPKGANWDAVVMDGNWVMTSGEWGTFDSYPLTDLFDATTGENPVYTLTRFTKVMSGPIPKHSAINHAIILGKSYSSMYASESEDDNYWLRGGCGKAAAMISKDLDQKNTPYHYEIGLAYIEGAFMGNHIVVISEAGDQDHYGTQGAKKRWENMMLSELVDQELPASMVEDIITFEWHKVDPEEDWSVEIAGEYLPVSGPMITKDTLSMSAEDKDRYHDCATCNRKNVDNQESGDDDACHMVGCGNYFCYQCMDSGNLTFGLSDHEDSKLQETYFEGSFPSVGKCCLQKAINLGFKMFSGYGRGSDESGWLETLVEDGHLPDQNYVSMNYVLGGLQKMSAEDCSQCNRTNIDNDDNEYDEYCGGCGAYLCDECYDGGNNSIRWEMDWPHEWEPPYLSKHETQQHWNNELVVAACCLQKAITYGFVPAYQGVESLKDVMKPYQYVSMNYVLGGLDKMSAESYPTCYLCPKPAKIEVMTAIGMRNFCGNKCRGDYEGIDYGPDDYYISPKLEHDIELVSYDPGYIGDRYEDDSATLSAKCRNCDFSTRNQSFFRHHLVKTLRKWDEEMEEWWETGEKCRHDKMQYLDYLENGEDAWGNIISGHIVIGCPTCGFKDTLDHVNIPQGCDNQGRIEDYLRF